MNAQDPTAEIFDVFLCHNSEDKPALGQQIESIKSAAVFVGDSGMGPWQDEEIPAFLSQFVKRKCPVIPTMLTSAKSMPEWPWTLEDRNWVDRSAAGFRFGHIRGADG